MDSLPGIGISVWSLAKGFVLFGLAIYIVFALVVVKQVSLMINTIEVAFEKPVQLLSYAHLIFALGVFVLALLIL